MSENRKFLTTFTETDKGNFISMGIEDEGYTFVARTDKGWTCGTVKKGETPDTDTNVFTTEIEAMKEAANENGYVVYCRDIRKNYVMRK